MSLLVCLPSGFNCLSHCLQRQGTNEFAGWVNKWVHVVSVHPSKPSSPAYFNSTDIRLGLVQRGSYYSLWRKNGARTQPQASGLSASALLSRTHWWIDSLPVPPNTHSQYAAPALLVKHSWLLVSSFSGLLQHFWWETTHYRLWFPISRVFPPQLNSQGQTPCLLIPLFQKSAQDQVPIMLTCWSPFSLLSSMLHGARFNVEEGWWGENGSGFRAMLTWVPVTVLPLT